MIASSAPLAPISYGVRGTLSGSGQYGSVGVSPSAKWGVSLAQVLRRPLSGRPTIPPNLPGAATLSNAVALPFASATPRADYTGLPRRFSPGRPLLSGRVLDVLSRPQRLWASGGTRASDDREVTVLAGGTGPLGSRRHPTRLGVRTASVTEGTRRRTGCGVDSRRRMAGLMSSRAGISKPLATRVMV